MFNLVIAGVKYKFECAEQGDEVTIVWLLRDCAAIKASLQIPLKSGKEWFYQ